MQIQQGSSQGSEEQAARAVEGELRRAILGRDRATLERIFADDFVATGHLGNVVNKKQYIDIHLSPEREFVQWDTDDVTSRRLGDAVLLLLGRITIRNAKSATQNPPNRYLAAYVKRGGVWQIAAWQETPIKAEQAR